MMIFRTVEPFMAIAIIACGHFFISGFRYYYGGRTDGLEGSIVILSFALFFATLTKWYTLSIMAKIIMIIYMLGTYAGVLYGMYLYTRLHPKNAIKEMKRDWERMEKAEEKL